MPKCINNEELDNITKDFQMIFESVATDLLTEQLERKNILIHLAQETQQNSRYAINKDQKTKIWLAPGTGSVSTYPIRLFKIFHSKLAR
ncbi:MAG: hypothetical protein D3923_07760 [Candidatus Electrothrix sp. AR3]|nr:hypothetical protein [Candidatus Electrothrix sp. AR3]